jgi:F420-0:gamma-glutamyl ligase
MNRLPDYLGVNAFGVKMGVILSGDDIVEEVYKVVKKCYSDDLIDDGDILCIKESIVARAQNNYVSKEEIAQEAKEKLKLTKSDNLGILFPISSRNRFVPILEGLVKSVPKGKVTIQFSYPRDCVGNQIAPENLEELFGINLNKQEVLYDTPEKSNFCHPETGVNYLELYKQIIDSAGCKSEIFLSNNLYRIIDHDVDGIIVSCIHEDKKTLDKIKKKFKNSITLRDLCNDKTKNAWCEWGLLGTNMHSDEQVKLAPRESCKIANRIQEQVLKGLGKKVEVTIYGDGAYMDPSTKIYELADPVCSFGCTNGLKRRRTGIKYKYFVGKLHCQGKQREEIESIIEKEKQKTYKINDISMEGTTPRKMEDIVGSLADLISGSADAGTPLVIVKNML